MNGGTSRQRFTILRYMFVYGSGQSPKHGYPSVIVKNFLRMLKGQRPLIYGDGSQVLDYVFVDDVVEATILALRPEGDGHIYNVGSGESTSMPDTSVLKTSPSPSASTTALMIVGIDDEATATR